MYILHIASELAPIAKVGGLGDVVYGLSKELIRQGHRVEILLPKYDCIDYNLLKNLKVCHRELWSFEGPYRYNNTIWSAEFEDLSILLIEPHHPHYFFTRGSIYNCPDDLERFLYFARASMEFLFKAGKTPDVLHLHDWPVAIAPVLQKQMYKALGLPPIKSILTLHNLEHQGCCLPKHLSLVGLRGEEYLTEDKLQDPANPLLINLLKGGIVYADAITTVSPSYEKEIKTSHGGHGLDKVLLAHQSKLKGILNGIDEDFWNPEKDRHLSFPFKAHPPFSSAALQEIDEQKKKNKKALQKRLGLEEKDVPLVACISRLVSQKSPALIAEAFRYALSLGGQAVVLGSPDSPEVKELFSSLLLTAAQSNSGAILLDYNEPLAHLIYAASDLLVVPSLFEPCGLTQMIALRYGTIPLVRKTGGLADTVFDIDFSTAPIHKRNGFVFKSATKEELRKALARAFLLWQEHPEKWLELRKQAMETDYSWKAAAKHYISLYENTPLCS
jgi:starch synthase